MIAGLRSWLRFRKVSKHRPAGCQACLSSVHFFNRTKYDYQSWPGSTSSAHEGEECSAKDVKMTLALMRRHERTCHTVARDEQNKCWMNSATPILLGYRKERRGGSDVTKTLTEASYS